MPRGTAFGRLRNVTKLFGNANDDDLVAAQNVAPIVVPTTDAMAATRLIYRDELDPGVDKRRQDIAGRVAAGDWPVHTCRHWQSREKGLESAWALFPTLGCSI